MVNALLMIHPLIKTIDFKIEEKERDTISLSKEEISN